MADQFFSLSKARVAAAFVGILVVAVIAPPLAGAQTLKCLGLTATIVGTPGDDRIIGTDQKDVIIGLGGNDTIFGGGGRDFICGRDGDDILRGGPGNDVLVAGGGNDEVYGGTGNDAIFGGTGNDVLRGGKGLDGIEAGRGDDRSYGGLGFDAILGGPGSDLIRGGPGPSILYGDDGDDQIFGGSDRDQIFGGPGNDAIRSRSGFDWIEGAAGNDTIYAGTDDDAVWGGSGNDAVFGGSGDDDLLGHQGSDRLYGGPGADGVFGGVGPDEVYGGSDDDTCDQDGAETPRSCESVGSVSYRTIEVQGSGSGFDPTGSYFGDRYYDGAVVRVFGSAIAPERVVEVYEATVSGSNFTIQIPRGGGILNVDKAWTFPFRAYDVLEFDDDTQGPLKPDVYCCVNPYDPNPDEAESASPTSSADAATQQGLEVFLDAQAADSGQPRLELTDEMLAETRE